MDGVRKLSARGFFFGVWGSDVDAPAVVVVVVDGGGEEGGEATETRFCFFVGVDGAGVEGCCSAPPIPVAAAAAALPVLDRLFFRFELNVARVCERRSLTKRDAMSLKLSFVDPSSPSPASSGWLPALVLVAGSLSELALASLVCLRCRRLTLTAILTVGVYEREREEEEEDARLYERVWVESCIGGVRGSRLETI